MRIERVIQETEDGSLRSFELTFKNSADLKVFYSAFNPDNFVSFQFLAR